jgi:FkbM family methyltransferase
MHGVSSSTKNTLMTRLANIPLVHRAVRAFRVQKVVAAALGVRPITRRLPKTGCEYRIRFLESMLMADEIFKREIYRAAFDGKAVRTFVDIGANVGYFTLYAAEITGRKDLTGLAVDADAKMADEVRWHLAKNALTGTEVRTGVAGYPPGVTEATFFVNPSNVASSAQPVLNPDVPAKGESKPVTVPAVDVTAEWKKLAGDKRIDLLKIDVEGFELDLIRNSSELFSLTDRLVLEWHKWVTSLDEVDALLAERGLVRIQIITEDSHAGVAVYDRRAKAA